MSASTDSNQQQSKPTASNVQTEKTAETPTEKLQKNSSQENKDDTLVQEPSSPFEWVRDENGEAKGISVILNKTGVTPKRNIYLDMRIKNMTDRVITLHRNHFQLKTADGQILDTTLEDSFTSGEIKLAPRGHIDIFKVAFNVQPEKIDSVALVDSRDEPLSFVKFDENSKKIEVTSKETPVPAEASTKADGFLYDELVNSYENMLISAINQEDFSLVEPMLLKGSSLYRDQKKLVEDLSQRGIKEELVQYEIKNTENDTESKTMYITVREVIKVKKKDGESTNEYTWVYTVKKNDEGRFQFSDIRKP